LTTETQNSSAVQASHPDRIGRGFLLLPFVTARRRNDCFSPTALPLSRSEECRICQKPVALRRSRDRAAQLLRWPAALPVLSNRRGEEAAMPGQPARAHARFWDVPRRLTFVNHRLPLALPQSSGQFRNAHVSLNPLSVKLLRVAIQKTVSVVKKLWRMRVPCGGMRKTKP